MMKISSVLATKGASVVTARPNQTIREAIALLKQHNIGALVIVNESNSPVGILSERDIVRHATTDERLFDKTVEHFMTTNLITGTSSDDVDAVLNQMTQGHFRHLPICEHDKLIGIVTIGDVVKARLNEYKGEMDTLEQQIRG